MAKVNQLFRVVGNTGVHMYDAVNPFIIEIQREELEGNQMKLQSLEPPNGSTILQAVDKQREGTDCPGYQKLLV